MITIYVFDISGLILAAIQDRKRYLALWKAFDFLKIKRGGDYDRLVSTQKNQMCLHKSYYLTEDSNFKVNYKVKNHNPLRPDRLHPKSIIVTDIGGAFLKDSKVDFLGQAHEFNVDEEVAEMWNDIFLVDNNLCYNPYYEY